MSIQDIRTVFDILNAPILFVWTIDKFLWQTERMFSDYKLHARFVWDKENGVAPAFTVRYSHEYLLWFYKSPMQKIDQNARGKYTTIIRERSTVHSRKPEFARQMVENLYPNSARIELFARKKFDGWDAWGNEVESDINLEDYKREER